MALDQFHLASQIAIPKCLRNPVSQSPHHFFAPASSPHQPLGLSISHITKKRRKSMDWYQKRDELDQNLIRSKPMKFQEGKKIQQTFAFGDFWN
jgi:hypothetical protein